MFRGCERRLCLRGRRGAGLRVISVADPIHPVEVGHFDAPGVAFHLKVVGNYAYVACTLAGLHIISIADPAHPVEVGVVLAGRS